MASKEALSLIWMQHHQNKTGGGRGRHNTTVQVHISATEGISRDYWHSLLFELYMFWTPLVRWHYSAVVRMYCRPRNVFSQGLFVVNYMLYSILVNLQSYNTTRQHFQICSPEATNYLSQTFWALQSFQSCLKYEYGWAFPAFTREFCKDCRKFRSRGLVAMSSAELDSAGSYFAKFRKLWNIRISKIFFLGQWRWDKNLWRKNER